MVVISHQSARIDGASTMHGLDVQLSGRRFRKRCCFLTTGCGGMEQETDQKRQGGATIFIRMKKFGFANNRTLQGGDVSFAIYADDGGVWAPNYSSH